MRIFALETNIGKLKQRFLHEGEREVLFTRYHALKFLVAILRDLLVTSIFIGIGVAIAFFNWPPLLPSIAVLIILWIFTVFFHLLRSFIDWKYDFILVTTDKVLLVDQASIFHQEVQPLHLENVGGVSARTQFWNILPFGVLTIQLRISGDKIVRTFIPRVHEVAGMISEVMTKYQRETHGNGEKGV